MIAPLMWWRDTTRPLRSPEESPSPERQVPLDVPYLVLEHPELGEQLFLVELPALGSLIEEVVGEGERRGVPLVHDVIARPVAHGAHDALKELQRLYRHLTGNGDLREVVGTRRFRPDDGEPVYHLHDGRLLLRCGAL